MIKGFFTYKKSGTNESKKIPYDVDIVKIYSTKFHEKLQKSENVIDDFNPDVVDQFFAFVHNFNQTPSLIFLEDCITIAKRYEFKQQEDFLLSNRIKGNISDENEIYIQTTGEKLKCSLRAFVYHSDVFFNSVVMKNNSPYINNKETVCIYQEPIKIDEDPLHMREIIMMMNNNEYKPNIMYWQEISEICERLRFDRLLERLRSYSRYNEIISIINNLNEPADDIFGEFFSGYISQVVKEKEFPIKYLQRILELVASRHFGSNVNGWEAFLKRIIKYMPLYSSTILECMNVQNFDSKDIRIIISLFSKRTKNICKKIDSQSSKTPENIFTKIDKLIEENNQSSDNAEYIPISEMKDILGHNNNNKEMIFGEIEQPGSTISHIYAVYKNEFMGECNVYNERGETPLHVAARYGNIEFARSFINYHPNSPNQTDRFGRTPAHIAAGMKHHDLFEILINDDCKDMKDDSGNTPYDVAQFHASNANNRNLINYKSPRDPRNNGKISMIYSVYPPFFDQESNLTEEQKEFANLYNLLPRRNHAPK